MGDLEHAHGQFPLHVCNFFLQINKIYWLQ